MCVSVSHRRPLSLTLTLSLHRHLTLPDESANARRGRLPSLSVARIQRPRAPFVTADFCSRTEAAPRASGLQLFQGLFASPPRAPPCVNFLLVSNSGSATPLSFFFTLRLASLANKHCGRKSECLSEDHPPECRPVTKIYWVSTLQSLYGPGPITSCNIH